MNYDELRRNLLRFQFPHMDIKHIKSMKILKSHLESPPVIMRILGRLPASYLGFGHGASAGLDGAPWLSRTGTHGVGGEGLAMRCLHPYIAHQSTTSTTFSLSLESKDAPKVILGYP